MDPVLTILGIVSVMLYLFNQVSFIPAAVRQWITSIVALVAVVWGVGATLGWFGLGWFRHH